jgi:hypothetical protein
MGPGCSGLTKPIASRHRSQSISNSDPGTSFIWKRPVASLAHSRRMPWSVRTLPASSPVNFFVLIEKSRTSAPKTLAASSWAELVRKIIGQ